MDLTHSLQRIAGMPNALCCYVAASLTFLFVEVRHGPNASLPLWKRADERFFWNRYCSCLICPSVMIKTECVSMAMQISIQRLCDAELG